MNQPQKHSDYDVYRLCKAMREMNSVKFAPRVEFTNEIIFGKSLLNIDENLCDSKDNCILSFIVDSNNKKK